LLDTFKQFQWHKLELPGRHFRWRIRGNPLSWLDQLPEDEPDLILATSMVDLATLKGLHPRLADVPCIYYFHENQFAYPLSDNQVNSVEPMMVQLYGSLAADKLLFNSRYNRDSFLQGIDVLLNKFPDNIPESITEILGKKSDVLPLAVSTIGGNREKNKKLILWNHRWEYDKAPQVFADALIKLKQSGVAFELALLGQRPAVKPDSLAQLEDQLNGFIIANGKLNRDEYHRYVSQSSIVVSTAIHEFQGLSVLEAVSGGAVPLVPDALCYREQYDDVYRYPPGDSDALSERLCCYLERLPEPPDVSYWSSRSLLENWSRSLQERMA
jgi:glycosyltransferase involved in cell wall biosynthesis